MTENPNTSEELTKLNIFISEASNKIIPLGLFATEYNSGIDPTDLNTRCKELIELLNQCFNRRYILEDIDFTFFGIAPELEVKGTYPKI